MYNIDRQQEYVVQPRDMQPLFYKNFKLGENLFKRRRKMSVQKTIYHGLKGKGSDQKGYF